MNNERVIQINPTEYLSDTICTREYQINNHKKIIERWSREKEGRRNLSQLLPKRYQLFCHTLKCLEDGYKVEFLNSEGQVKRIIEEGKNK